MSAVQPGPTLCLPAAAVQVGSEHSPLLLYEYELLLPTVTPLCQDSRSTSAARFAMALLSAQNIGRAYKRIMWCWWIIRSVMRSVHLYGFIIYILIS